MDKYDAISREYCLKMIGQLPLCWEYGAAVDDCYKIVQDAPSIDVAPVVHAYWDEHDGKTWCIAFGASNNTYKPPFCPYCGARMDKNEV